MANIIDRKVAEAAKARAKEICDDPALPEWFDAERVACLKLWNAFVAQEAARMAKPANRYGMILPGIFVRVA
jgi:hypothetical protein